MDSIFFDTCEYGAVLNLQIDLLKKRIDDKINDTVIICEHFPVVTFGRIYDEKAIKGDSFFREEKIPFVFTGRGGYNTYHSPGQIVMYPIIKLENEKKDISKYIDLLEKTVSNSLNKLGILAKRDDAKRGVWVDNKKIAFIGVAFKKWTTYHGIAINVNNNITPFDQMDTCGEKDIKVTSVKEILGRETNINEVKQELYEQFVLDWKNM